MYNFPRDGIGCVNARQRRSALRRLAAGFAVLALGWPLSAPADCVDTRKASAGETDFFNRAIATLVAALPPAPVGATLQRSDSVPTLGQQCQGKTGDFTLEVNRYYEHNYRKSIVTMAMNVTQMPVSASGPFAAYGASSPGRSAGLKVHNVVWKAEGSDSPLRQALADAIDRARLQALVGKPLPSIAESRALAAQAVPATVAGAAPAPNSPAAQPAAANAPAGAAPGQAGTEPLRDAADTVNKLRGLFGR